MVRIMYVQRWGYARPVTPAVRASSGHLVPPLVQYGRLSPVPPTSARAHRLLRPGGEDRVVQEPVGRRRALLTHGHRRDEPVRPQVLRASYYKMSQEHQHAVARFSNLRSRKIGRDWRLTTLDISLLLHKMGRI